MSKRPHVDLLADCACGAVSISVNGTVDAMLLCSCTECQKASGAGHTAVAITGRDGVNVTGETRAFTRPADSGATMTRHFCPVCATSLYAESSRRPDAALLPVGLFGGTDWFDPSQVIFARSHLDWDNLPDIPRHETYRDA